MHVISTMDEHGDELRIEIHGRFDFNVLEDFKNCYEAVKQPVKKYVIDLSQSDYLDSSAMGMLLTLREYAGGDKAQIQLVQVKPDIKKILTITRLNELFSIHEL